MNDGAGPAREAPQRVWWLLSAAVVTLVTVSVVALVIALRGDGSDDAGAAPATTSPVATTAAPTTTLGPGDIADVADDAARFVEAARGHRFAPQPEIVVLPDDVFASWQTGFETDPLALRTANVMARGFGLIGPVDDIAEVEAEFADLTRLAEYDGADIVVRERPVTPALKLALVRALTVALDDQLFGLTRPELAALDNDANFAFQSLVEGDAARVARLYRDTLSPEEQRRLDEEATATERALGRSDVPLPYRVLRLAPARYGETFVDGLYEHDGNAAIDAAFASPPTTSEQIFFVRSYFGREPNRTIMRPVPNTGGELLAEGPLGQATIMAILRSVHDEDVAWDAANGWAGDWFVAWQEGTSSCIRVTMVMETFDETKDLKAAFDPWGVEQFGRAIVFSEEDRVVVTNCVG